MEGETMNIIELPMNKKPFVRSNISRASLFSILTSEAYSGELNTSISSCSLSFFDTKGLYGSRGEFCRKINDVRVDVDKLSGKIKVFSHPYKENKYAYFYKRINMDKNFTFETKIDYIQDANALSCVKLVLSEGLVEGTLEDNNVEFENEISISITPKGRLIFSSTTLEKEFVIKNIDISNGIVLRLDFNECLEAKYSKDGVEWVDVMTVSGDLKKIKEVGMFIHPRINPFYYDFFVSHIQLCCTTDTMVIAPHFEAYERVFSTSLQVMHMPMDMLDISDKKIVDYFVELIEKKYYINMGLNENYIPGRSSYQVRDYIHVNFIYGVDKERRVFKLLGFDTTLKYDEIDFDNFFLAIQRRIDPTSKINLYKYDSKGYPKKFNLPLAIRLLEAYLEGKGIVALSSNKTMNIEKTQPIMFGLDIIEHIISDEYYMDGFIKDKRVIFQIQEHIEIVIKMVEFLKYINLLSDELSKVITDKLNEVHYQSQIILNLVLKNMISDISEIKEKLREKLINLKKMEQEALSDLILSLKKAL